MSTRTTQDKPPLRLTARGWLVLLIACILAAIGINLAARDACWDSNRIASCTQMIREHEQTMLKEGETWQTGASRD